jgi:hypothetical protein
MMKRSIAGALLAVALLTPACNDPVRMVATENDPTLVNDVDSFRYQAFRLDNVHDTLRWTWTNRGAQAVVTNSNFIPHGQTRLTVSDPDGVVVYQAPLLSPEGEPLSHATRLGRPGNWTIELDLYGVDGARIDFSVDRTITVVPTPSPEPPKLR